MPGDLPNRCWKILMSGKCQEMLMPLLQKQPGNVILYVVTNDASTCNSSETVNTILKLRSFICQKLPNVNAVLSKPIMRSDTAAGKVNIEEVNKQLNDFDYS